MLLWMLSAIVFATLLGVAAWFGEQALRAAGRPTRGAWLFAMCAGALWPVLVPLLRALQPETTPRAAGVAMLDAVRIAPAGVTGAGSWWPMLDRTLLGAWIVCSALLLLRYLFAWRAVNAVRRSAERTEVDGVRVLVSGALGPAVVGLRDAAVLIPHAVLDLDASLRTLVLRHEEEHRRAHDTWFLLAIALTVSALPWNLPLWWIARRVRLALEVDCDARVLAAGASAGRYSQVLLLAAQRTSAAPLTPMLVASRSHLERRIVAMQERIALESRGRMRTWRVAGATLVSIVALAAACSSPIADQTAATRASSDTKAPTVGDRMPNAVPQVTKEPYFEFQVEKPVATAPGSTFPTYPPELKKAHIEGEVLAQYVVDTAGRAETSTFKVLKPTRPEFIDAVKKALPDMRFTPAEIGGRKVKQLVQQPFTFAISKPEIAGPIEIPNPKRSK